MNQYISIRYKPGWMPDPNYWNFWFILNEGEHREKSPSAVNSYGDWEWHIHDKSQKRGYDFDWMKNEPMD